jgi:hypothetical protein
MEDVLTIAVKIVIANPIDLASAVVSEATQKVMHPRKLILYKPYIPISEKITFLSLLLRIAADPNDENVVVAHGREWKIIPGVPEDPSNGLKFSRRPCIRHGSRLSAIPVIQRTAFDYFHHFYPTKSIPLTLHAINERLHLENEDREVTENEFLAFLGIRLVMALEPRRGGTKAFWKSDSAKVQRSFSQIDMGEVSKMSRTRFEEILSNLAF